MSLSQIKVNNTIVTNVDEVPSYNNNLIKSKPIFITNHWLGVEPLEISIIKTKNYFIDRNGSKREITQSRGFITELIELNCNDKIIIPNLIASDSFSIISKYINSDTNYKPLVIGNGTSSWTTSTYEYIASEDMYIIISGSYKIDLNEIIIFKAQIENGIIENIIDNTIQIDNQLNQLGGTSYNIDLDLNNNKNYYINSSGTLKSFDDNFYTELIELKQNDILTVTNLTANNLFSVIAKYDNSETQYIPLVIGIGENGWYTETYVYTSTEDMYITISGSLSTQPIATINRMNNGIITDILNQISTTPILSTKTLYSFGDSLVYGHYNAEGMFDGLKDELMSYNKYAQNGAQIVNETWGIYKQIENAPNGSPDFIGFNGLTNDAGGTIMDNLGTLSSTYDGQYDTTTFYGSFEKILWLLSTKYPYSKIFFVASHKMPTRDLIIQDRLHEIARECCFKWSIPIVDIYRNGQINTCIQSKVDLWSYYDEEHGKDRGTHLSLNGYKTFYQPLIKEMMLKII